MVILKAYAHQVGGHTQLVKFEDSSNKVFKPLQENEFQFYERLLSLHQQATATGFNRLQHQVPLSTDSDYIAATTVSSSSSAAVSSSSSATVSSSSSAAVSSSSSATVSSSSSAAVSSSSS
eukprot:Lankesteria_metandrocarpae@DN2599_c0_g1_i2.p1